MNVKKILSDLKSLIYCINDYSDPKVEITSSEKKNKNEVVTEEILTIKREDIDLSKLIDDTVDSYLSSLHIETSSREKLKNFIEKMAVWYELRYPDYEVNRLIPRVEQEDNKISDVMFSENQYINDFLDSDTEIKYLDWDEFYNANSFLKSLPQNERKYITKPRYNRVAYVDINNTIAHLHLNANGIVISSEGMSDYTLNKVKDKTLTGKHIVEVVKLLKEKSIKLPEGNGLEENIRSFLYAKVRKDMLLDAVMYRIIERGGKDFGPSRGLLFAKEFKRDIDVPMMYGVSDIGDNIEVLLNEYIKAGGKKDLICYKNYFNDYEENEEITTVTVDELLQECDIVQEENEKELYQRMVNALNSSIDPVELRKEQIKKLRLERKLANSRKNKTNKW